MMITRQVRCKKCGEMFPLTYPEKLSDIDVAWDRLKDFGVER